MDNMYLDKSAVLNRVEEHFFHESSLPGCKHDDMEHAAYHGTFNGQSCACAIGLFDPEVKYFNDPLLQEASVRDIRKIRPMMLEQVFHDYATGADGKCFCEEDYEFLHRVQSAHDSAVSDAYDEAYAVAEKLCPVGHTPSLVETMPRIFRRMFRSELLSVRHRFGLAKHAA